MYSHLNDPFSEGGRRTCCFRAVGEKNHSDTFSAYECVLQCRSIFLKDLVDILHEIVILNFRLLETVVEKLLAGMLLATLTQDELTRAT